MFPFYQKDFYIKLLTIIFFLDADLVIPSLFNLRMQFIGRQKEQNALTCFIASDLQEAALIYDRRRIGKTELILRVINNVSCIKIYYQCLESTQQKNCEELSKIISDAFELSL